MAQNDLVISNQSFPSFRSDLNSALQAIQTTHSGTSLPTGALAGQIWLDTTSATSPTLKIYDGTDSISLAIIDYTTNTVNWLDSSLSYNSTATSAGTLVLTVSSSYKQYFTGTTTHTVTLPVASTLTVGQTFEIHNNSTGSITVNSSGSNLVGTVEANVTASITCILASGTTAASWDFDVTGFTSAVPTTRGGTGLTTIGSSLQVLRTNSGATGLEFATISQATPFTVTGDNVSGASIRLPEDTDNGSNYVAIKAPDNLASNLTLTLPSADGTSGQVLQTNGSGVLSFASVSAANTPAFIAYLTSQSISSGTDTKIQFNGEVLDTNSCFDSTTNYRFTPTTAGYYHFGLVTGGSAISTYCGLYIMKNGSTRIYFYDTNTNSSYLEGGNNIIYMNGSTDYVEGYVYLSTTRTISGNAGNTYYTRFWGYRLIGL